MRAMLMIVALTAWSAGANPAELIPQGTTPEETIPQVTTSEEMTFSNVEHPIRRVISSFGEKGYPRLEYVEAIIYNHHLTNSQRMNFNPWGSEYEEVRAPGDERGYFVGSRFSGPREWFNETPQNSRVNRGMRYQAISPEWYKIECNVERFLEGGSYRWVHWTVNMTYAGDSNRPNEYQLTVRFEGPCGTVGKEISTRIPNPTYQEDSTFWICRKCRSIDDLQNSNEAIEEDCRIDSDTCKASGFLKNPTAAP